MERKLLLSGLFFSLIIFLGFGFFRLGDFMTVDEGLWTNLPDGRIIRYVNAMTNGDFLETRINDKPGVSVALVSGIPLFLEQALNRPFFVAKSTDPVDAVASLKSRMVAHRATLLIVNAFGIVLLIFLFWRLLENCFSAVFFGFTVALSPILIGISRIVNPDALLWIFGGICLLSYHVFLKKRIFLYAALSGVALGFSLLSKYTASIFIFYLFFISFFYFLYQQDIGRNLKKGFVFHGKHFQFFLEIFLGYFLTFIVSLVVFCIFMPAVLYNPSFLYQGILGFYRSRESVNIFLIVAGLLLFSWFIFEFFLQKKGKRGLIVPMFERFFLPLFMFSPAILAVTVFLSFFNWMFGDFLHIGKILPFARISEDFFQNLSFFSKVLVEFKALLFSVNAFLSFFVFFALARYCFLALQSFLSKKKMANSHSFLMFFVPSITWFCLLFVFAVSVMNVWIHPRYSILLYVPWFVLSAIGFFWFTHLGFFSSGKRVISLILIFLFLFFGVGVNIAIMPFYFNYTIGLLPKDQMISHSWGAGGYEAAQYLNERTKVVGREVSIFSDYTGVCAFYEGKSCHGSKEFQEDYDFYVVTYRGLQDNLWEEKWLVNNPHLKLVWEIKVNNQSNSSVRVYEQE